jgi:hypothetical protein
MFGLVPAGAWALDGADARSIEARTKKPRFM